MFCFCCFLSTALPCSPTFCCSAIPTSCNNFCYLLIFLLFLLLLLFFFMEELQKLCGIIIAIKTMLSFFDFTDRNSNCSHIFQQNLNSFFVQTAISSVTSPAVETVPTWYGRAEKVLSYYHYCKYNASPQFTERISNCLHSAQRNYKSAPVQKFVVM